MRVGIGLVFQNLRDEATDQDVYRNEIGLGNLAEPLGFESLWMTEHHFTDYMLSPEPTQLLTYFAGRTSPSFELGTMGIILPWHDPVRVATQVAVLDNISEGRYIFGFGRGLAASEFEGFRIPMSESRERVRESLDILLKAFDTGVIEADTPHYTIPKRAIRPRPTRPFRDRTYGAAVSPESMDALAEAGVGMLISAQKPWDKMASGLADYQEKFRAAHGTESPVPIVNTYVFCDPDPVRARDLAHQYLETYYKATLDHYSLDGDQFTTLKGYEYYKGMASGLSDRGRDKSSQYFADLQVWGDPRQCIEKIEAIAELTGMERYIVNFAYSDMPYAEAERNTKLFAAEVLPTIKRFGTDAAAGPDRSGAAALAAS